MTVIENTTKKKCEQGEVTLGVGVRLSRTPDIGMIMKSCGFDWLFIDTEHGTLDLDTAAQISTAALHHGITPVVRVASGDSHLSTRILDGGAQGIVLPHVNGPEEARAWVSNCKFPPEGQRSNAGSGPQAAYASLPLEELLPALNRETLLVAMIETTDAADQADAIAAVEGIDVLLVGTNDLCLEMGIPGQFENERVSEVYQKVISACKKHGKTPGMGGVYDPEIVSRRIEEGMRFILAGGDANFLIKGATTQADSIRNHAP